MSTSPTLLIVPGWRNAGPGHWQSLWVENLPGAVRVQQADRDTPSKSAWVRTLAQAVMQQSGPVVVVAHNLGCIATVSLPPEAAQRIQGALLVAPADPERLGVLADFSPVPYQALPYPSIVVASSNDPCCSVRTAGAYARAWGSEMMRLQNAGHLNADAGLGEWPLGMALLQSLMGATARLPQTAI